MLSSGLLMVHDTLVGGEHDKAELSGGKDLVNKVFEILELEVETGGDNSALVQTTVKVDNDLAIAGIVDDLELVDVAVLLHHTEELDENLGDRSQENLQAIPQG